MEASTLQAETIAVDDLRVGMLVHLDRGWWEHPFRSGSFRIASAAQIATIRELGIERLRWSPVESVPVADPDTGSATEWAEARVAPPTPAPGVALPTPAPGVALPTPAPGVTLPGTGLGAPRRPTTSADAERLALAAQRSAQRAGERRFAEAARAFRALAAEVEARPTEARAGAERLTRGLLDEMSGDRDLCIRLLTESSGDRASTHALNVTVIALLMGRALGLPPEDLEALGLGALLHDIGKLQLPERVRRVDEQFTAAETRLYETHVAHGVAQARRMGLSAAATAVIAGHHEFADGSGFPHRLDADRTALTTRIVALANRYDNLCNPGHPARTLTPHEALSLLFSQGSAKFDTAILAAFIRMMGVYPAGSTVQLTDDRFALVVGVNSSRPLKPRVVVHDARVDRDDARVVDLERSAGLGIRRSLRPTQLPEAALRWLAPQPRVTYYFDAVETLHDEPVAA